MISALMKAQTTNSKGKLPSFLELQIGAAGYSYFDAVAPSLQLNLATPVGKYAAFGVLLNAYSAIRSSTKVVNFWQGYTYRPKGVRAGFMLRFHTAPEKTHFYGELIGTVGRTYSTGARADPMFSKAKEFMGGANLGVNFKANGNNFFGFYIGASLGNLNYDEAGRESIARVQIGGTYHFKL